MLDKQERDIPATDAVLDGDGQDRDVMDAEEDFLEDEDLEDAEVFPPKRNDFGEASFNDGDVLGEE